ncbi:MAG: hypothetical protein E7157_03135 [Lactobacillales bacterium]|nr:hypothetical protein [Lactobacillales bacterium]
MIYDREYKYSFINKIEFDNKYLGCKIDGSKYKKYILVSYKDNNKIKYIDIPNESYLYKFNNIINNCEIEEIISTCIHFDAMYDELYYFHINDLYFIKYKMSDEDMKLFGLNNDSKKIKTILEKMFE